MSLFSFSKYYFQIQIDQLGDLFIYILLIACNSTYNHRPNSNLINEWDRIKFREWSSLHIGKI